MVAWSNLIFRNGLPSSLQKCVLSPKTNSLVKLQGVNHILVRTCKSKGGTFNIIPSTFTFNKTKDIMKFYLTICCLPYLAVILYTNIFIGPATLKPIPEGYEPKYWEYYSHPISRFICKYLVENPQKTYEKACYVLFYNDEQNLLREIEKKVKFLISDRRDFQAWYYTPAYLKYTKNRVKKLEKLHEEDLISQNDPIYK